MADNLHEELIMKALSEDLNVLVKGSPGIGKTTALQKLAKRFFADSITIDCGLISEPEDWFAKPILKENGLEYKPVFLGKVANRKNVLVIFDELNRVQNERAMNALYPVLDYRKGIYIPQLDTELDFTHISFAATINESEDLVHTGTVTMDTAIYSRFVTVKIAAPDWGSIAKNKQVAKIASNLRGCPVSYRQIHAADKLIDAGVDPNEAIVMAFSTIADEQTVRRLLTIV